MIRPSKAVALAFALVAANAALPARAAGPMAVQPGAVEFHVGNFDAFVLRDARILIPNDGSVFGGDAGPEAVKALLAKAGAPTDSIRLSISALLLKGGGRFVLLDTGLGAKNHGALMTSLGMTGVRPEQITDIMITHAHFDHIGGLVGEDGGSAFPNATVHMSAAEWTYMQAQAPDVAKVVAAQVKTFEPGGLVIAGITSVRLDGHTPGHVGYEIVEGHGHLLDIGDMAHSSILSLAHPEWTMGFDSDKAAAIKTRTEMFAKLAKSHEPVFSPHFPYPGVGVVELRKGAYVWNPQLGTPTDY
jgi:glyoxylase-like metal-dependent hydrolase (beta-lactamase superfamily II)